MFNVFNSDHKEFGKQDFIIFEKVYLKLLTHIDSLVLLKYL